MRVVTGNEASYRVKVSTAVASSFTSKCRRILPFLTRQDGEDELSSDSVVTMPSQHGPPTTTAIAPTLLPIMTKHMPLNPRHEHHSLTQLLDSLNQLSTD